MNTYAEVGMVISTVASLRAEVTGIDVDALVNAWRDQHSEDHAYAYATGYLESVLQYVDRELTSLWGTLVALERSLMPASSEVES